LAAPGTSTTAALGRQRKLNRQDKGQCRKTADSDDFPLSGHVVFSLIELVFVVVSLHV